MSIHNVAFFGCWLNSGHILVAPGGGDIPDSEAEQSGLLRGHDLDGSYLLLPRPEVEGTGCCTYLPAFHLTVLSWWNRVFDARPNVNSHVMFRGKNSPTLMWDVFQHRFKPVASYHTKPTIRVVY